MMGRGVRAALVRPGAPWYVMKKNPSSLEYYRFWPWAIAGRGEYLRRTGGNEKGLRDPPRNYGSSCYISISITAKKCNI